MPPPELAGRNQAAVLWPKTGEDPNGETILGPPVQLDPARGTGVKWNWTSRDLRDPAGGVLAVEATVVVDRDVPDGSVLWEGYLRDFVDDGTNTLMQVVSRTVNPDQRGAAVYRRLDLARFRGTLPATGG